MIDSAAYLNAKYETLFKRLNRGSRQQQRELGETDDMGFEAFLERYFAQDEQSPGFHPFNLVLLAVGTTLMSTAPSPHGLLTAYLTESGNRDYVERKTNRRTDRSPDRQ